MVARIITPFETLTIWKTRSPHLHSRAQCRAPTRSTLHWGWRHGHALVYRKPDKALIAHSRVRTQLTWCHKEGVPRVIIIHCGSEIVTGDEGEISGKIRAMAAERRVDASIACDGMKLKLTPKARRYGCRN